MPTNTNINEEVTRIRSKNSDQNLVALAKRIAMAYGDNKVRLLSAREVEKVQDMNDIDVINKIIAKVPQMSPGQRLDFCDAFIGEDMSGLDLATPMILGEAYEAIKKRAEAKEENQQNRLDKLAARIDDLSADFANSGGMVVGQSGWPLVDMGCIADVYQGFQKMFGARLAEYKLMNQDNNKYKEIEKNQKYIEKLIGEYDNVWGLDKLRPEYASELEEHWDELYNALNRAELSEGTKKKLSKYKFLDGKNQTIPQFISGKHGDTEKYKEYESGFKIAKDGRLESVVELARHDVAKKHVADFIKNQESQIDGDTLEIELNDMVLTKLFEIDAAGKIVNAATENPELFADPKYREEFIQNLANDGGEISDIGYNAAIDAQTNATAGWAARVKNKLGAAAEKAGGFFNKVFNPIKRIDKMADVRMTRRSIEKREKRIELLKRILKGFASAAIASALITTIATAAAAAAGMSAALFVAAIGTVTAIGMGMIQVGRWRKAQEAAGLSTDINAFFKDKRLVASLGASLLAVVAMCFGVAGLATAAKWLGYGALAIGGSNNAAAAFRDARDAKMSAAESIAWAIANAGAVIGGGFAGRAVGHALTDTINYLRPRNELFQTKEPVESETPKEPVKEEIVENRPIESETPKEPEGITHERTVRYYTDEMLQSAKKAVENWYAHDYPNHPEILQQDIDAINQYNIDHNTNLDPYRILRAMKISQPSRLAYTPAWSNTYNVPQELISQAAHAVGGGVYDPAGMEAAKFLDANYLGTKGEVGDVLGRTINRTYSPITELPTETTETLFEELPTETPIKEPDLPEEITESAGDEPNYSNVSTYFYAPARGDGMAMFGNYTPRERISNLRNRIGLFLDRVRSNRRNEPVTEDVPQFISNDERKIPTFTLDEPQEQQLPPVILDEQDGKLRPTGANTPSPARREFVVPPISSKKLFPKPLFKDIKKPSVEPSRVQEPVQPVQSGLENMTVALTIPEIKKYEPYYDFALTEAQAERWNTLNKELGTTLAKMRNRSTHADDYMRLRKQANRLTDEINSFTAELGNPTAFQIEQALTEIERRKKLKDLIAQYERHMAKKPPEDSVSDWRNLKWKEELSKLADKIEALGGADSLDESKLRFATPQPGRLKQKLEEVAQREAARQQHPQRVFEMPMREEQPEERRPFESERKERDAYILEKRFEFEHPKPDFENRYPRDKHLDLRNRAMPQPVLKSAMRQNLVSYQLMEIRGVPVKLLYLDGQPNPIIKNGGHSMVIVDVNGLRIPFFCANGDEGNALFKAGEWYPAFEFRKDETNKAKLYINVKAYGYNSKELTKIAEELGNSLENPDGNNMSVFDYDTINKILFHGTDDSNSSLWAPSDSRIDTTPNDIANYLREVKAPGYNPFTHAVSRISDRVAGGFFNRRNVSNEHK